MKTKLLLASSVLALLLTLATGAIILGCGDGRSASTSVPTGPQPSEEVEATEFRGVKLTPIDEQGNNALRGTQVIDRDSYVLTVDGLVEKPLSLSYADLQSYDQESWLMDLNCVEGWSFTAKWTGPSLSAILADAQVKPEAIIAIFYSADVPTGYTSLNLDYILENNILLALKINDVTLPAERGFPLQVVAKSKFGYKWAKWVTRVELSSDTDFRGYWERAGYNNNADDDGPAFE
ncbi:MAG: molybdopterin-dependent oxidoreductase [Thermoleophilia bacterium]|nr:molybdopterin-dependent oxidoreductase [Thermoleophilia bacterium]